MKKAQIRTVLSLMFIGIIIMFPFYWIDWRMPKGDLVKNYEINSEEEFIEYSFNNRNGKYKAIHYSVQLEKGDLKFLIVDENNNKRYESAWYSYIEKGGQTITVSEEVIRSIGNATLIPDGHYRIRFELKGKTKGIVHIKWKS